MATIQPVVLFFVLGVLAGVMKSDLKIPEALYKSLSIFLLIAIGFKGGVSMAKYEIMEVLPIALSMVVLAALVPLTAYPILKKLGKFNQADAGAIAAHYGSVSAVTFAVGIAFLEGIKETSEGLHGPDHGADGDTGAGHGHGTWRGMGAKGTTQWGKLLHEILTGTSIFLMVGGVIVGYYAGAW